MLINLLKIIHHWLTASADRKGKTRFWLALSWLCALVYPIAALKQAFASEYIISDDARQHVFWLYRYLDGDLFPNDLIADYFQSVAPAGYTLFYRSFAALGIEPLLLAKLLPIALASIATLYCFGLCLQLFPIPAAGFVASFLFNQNLWMRDDLASGTPRAFLNPIFLAFLYYLVRRQLIPVIATIVLLGLFYPQYVLVASGILVLFPLTTDIEIDTKERRTLLGNESILLPDFLSSILTRKKNAIALLFAFLILLPYALKTSDFGPVIDVETAKQLPEFLPGGRVRFFYDDFGRFWLSGGRSGLQPALDPPLLCAGLLLPFLLAWKRRFPLLLQTRSSSRILLDLTLSSLFWFFAAHAFLFKLHLPSRYTQHSLRIVFSLAAAIALLSVLDAVLKWAISRQENAAISRIVALSLTTLIVHQLFFYQLSLDNFPKTSYIVGTTPEVYQFFAQQPPESLVASLSVEANNLPSFARRSILVGDEYAIPYHWGYYQQFQTRSRDLVVAQYSSNLAEVQDFIQRYGVDFWLLDRGWLSPEYADNSDWIERYDRTVEDRLKKGDQPALTKMRDRCTIFESEAAIVLDANCILNSEIEPDARSHRLD